MGAAFGFLCLLASLPLSGDPGRDAPHWLAGTILAVNLSFGLIAFLKGKPKLGTLGIFIPGLSIVGAIRLYYTSLPLGPPLLLGLQDQTQRNTCGAPRPALPPPSPPALRPDRRRTAPGAAQLGGRNATMPPTRIELVHAV